MIIKRIAILLFPLCLQVQAASTVSDIRQQLRSAVACADAKDTAGAKASVLAVMRDPAFETLDESTRHAAWALAAQLALRAADYEQAHQFAVLASQSTEGGVDDWRDRLTASMKLGDRRDEALCLTTIMRHWGRDSSILPAATVRQVVRDTLKIDAQARIDLLGVLYDLRWHPGDGSSVGYWWVELSRLLIEQNRIPDAIQVAALVEDPRSIIAFAADKRFRPLLKSSKVQSNARRAASHEIEELRAVTQQKPRSLQALQRLTARMVNMRSDVQALALIEAAVRRIDAAGEGLPPFDDMEKYGVLLDTEARALRNLGRYDEAVQQLRRGAELAHKTDSVSQPIDLALLLCELNRPDEAMAALPPAENASIYGKMLIALVQLTAAEERGAGDDADKALAYLREHRADSPNVLQDGLLRAGALDDAELLLVSRLNDPDERTSALIPLQTYFETMLPPRAAEWRARFAAVKERPAVRTAVAQFGEIDNYNWTYGYD
jgi:tetratricopeptide (TPR) repeat protein